MDTEEPIPGPGTASSPPEAAAATNPSRKIEVRINKLLANIVCILVTIIVCAACVGLAHLLPYFHPFSPWQFYLLLISIVVLVPVHEGLHALGVVLFAKATMRDFKFGIMWRAFMPYCHCKKILTVDQYRRMTLLPLQVTGTTSLATLIVYPSDALGMLAGFTLGTCVGDVWIAFKLRKFECNLLVQDCPSDVGCDVIMPNPDATP